MKIVYIAEQPPVKKITKKDEVMESAGLFASMVRNTTSSKRKCARIMEIELGDVIK